MNRQVDQIKGERYDETEVLKKEKKEKKKPKSWKVMKNNPGNE